MRWDKSIRWLNAILISSSLVGCHTARTIHYFGDSELEYYRDKVLEVQYPNVTQATPENVAYSGAPRTIIDEKPPEIWNLSLQEALHLSLVNNKMIRTRSQFLGNNSILTSPTTAPSVYDPAISETGFLFGRRGVEAALSDFDAQFATQMLWGRNENATNSQFGFAPGFVNTQETGQFNSSLTKSIVTGGQFQVQHNWNYLGTNNPTTLFPSSYTGVLGFNYTQPLWAGAGSEYTRIAGPARPGLGGLIGVNQGVVIARINQDISVADFEQSVLQMVYDVEAMYWDLYLAYRQYDAEVANQKSSLQTWTETHAKHEAQLIGFGAAVDAQATENYFETRTRVEQALANVYDLENQFRRLIGLGVNDGRLIRPSDRPVQAEFLPNWEVGLVEALNRRVELRRLKWQVKSLELQLVAARNAANPQLNFVSGYQINGFGDRLIASDNADGITSEGFNSAYGSMTRGDQTAWALGFQFSVPLGLRTAKAQERNIELQLMKQRAALAAGEQDVSHELAAAIQAIHAAYTIAKTNFDRRVASEERVQATEQEVEAGLAGATVDLLLRAQASRAAAEVALFTAVVNYNKAIADLHLRQGTLLDINGISIAEGEWVGAAKDEALRRAWARSYAIPNDHLEARPAEFSSPYPYMKTDLAPGAGVPVEDGATILNVEPALDDAPAGLPPQVPPAPPAGP